MMVVMVGILVMVVRLVLGEDQARLGVGFRIRPLQAIHRIGDRLEQFGVGGDGRHGRLGRSN
jgi:hypothetical protein